MDAPSTKTTWVKTELPPEEIARLNALAEEVPIDSITIGERVRRNFDHVPELAESIKEDGLIQPIVITYDRLLIAGESRIRAHKLLGHKTIRAVFRGCLDQAQLAVLEAKENNDRKALTWQERVLSIDKAHRYKSTEAAIAGRAWGMRETGKLVNQSAASISISTFIADFLHRNDEELWKCDSMSDAYRVLMHRKEKAEEAELAKQTLPSKPAGPQPKYTGPSTPKVPDSELLDGVLEKAGAPNIFIPGVAAPTDDEEMPGQVPPSGNVCIPLTEMLLKERDEDSLDVLKSQGDATYEHCITDWPYGIDMEYLNQNNIHGGLRDVASVTKQHDVQKNLTLQQRVVPEIFRVLKDKSFFITWCDPYYWRYGCDICEAAGFTVQRWPLVWHKTSSAMNQAAQANFTKDIEFAIVARKGTATILKPQPSCVWTGGNSLEAKLLGHPFAKPFGLWTWLYDAVATKGSRILDPFVGSGSSTIPAIKAGMRPVGIECSEEWYNKLVINVSGVYKSMLPNATFK